MERPCQHTYTGYSWQPCFALSPFLRSLARGMWRGTAPLLPRALCWCDSSKGLCWQHHLPLEAQTKDAAVGPGCLSVLGEEGLPASRPLTSCQLICSSKEVKLQPCGVCSSRDSPSEPGILLLLPPPHSSIPKHKQAALCTSSIAGQRFCL